MSDFTYPPSDDGREMAANALAATLSMLTLGEPETQDEWDAFAEDVANVEYNLLRDPEFCPSGIEATDD